MPIEKRSPLIYSSLHTIPVSDIKFNTGHCYIESVQCQDTVNISYNTNLLNKIFIIKTYKDNLCNYINDNSMWYRNWIVQSQYSVQNIVYTIHWQNVYSVSFRSGSHECKGKLHHLILATRAQSLFLWSGPCFCLAASVNTGELRHLFFSAMLHTCSNSKYVVNTWNNKLLH